MHRARKTQTPKTLGLGLLTAVLLALNIAGVDFIARHVLPPTSVRQVVARTVTLAMTAHAAISRPYEFVAAVRAIGKPGPKQMAWTPICAAFEEGSELWYLFFCYVDPPPKDPRT